MYNKNERALIFLSSFDFLTWKKEKELLDLFEEPAEIFDKLITLKDEVVQIVGEYNYKKIIVLMDDVYIESYLRALVQNGIECVTIYSENYPEKLKEIIEPPFVLFAKGNLELLNTKGVSIVGTRKPTAYGRSVTKEIATNLAKNNITIVSGMALGVDTIAHESALEVNGNTIAVLGAGFNYIYPTQNFELSNKIIEKGLLLTEYKPSVEVRPYNFPVRNRIIAGLSDVVVITEAGEKSGSLHTKEYALDCGRDVYAVPGNIYGVQSKGTNNLIKSGQAICLTSVNDILQDLDLKLVQNKKKDIQLDMSETAIINLLEDGEKHFDEISLKCKIDAKNLNSYLTRLQIRGIIKKLGGNYYSL